MNHLLGPEEITILAFRRLLERLNLAEQIFEMVKAHLKANGMARTQGTILDGHWDFCMKVHIVSGANYIRR